MITVCSSVQSKYNIVNQYGMKMRMALQLLMKVSKVELKNQSSSYFLYEVTERQSIRQV
jgi:hypothetical protein